MGHHWHRFALVFSTMPSLRAFLLEIVRRVIFGIRSDESRLWRHFRIFPQLPLLSGANNSRRMQLLCKSDEVESRQQWTEPLNASLNASAFAYKWSSKLLRNWATAYPKITIASPPWVAGCVHAWHPVAKNFSVYRSDWEAIRDRYRDPRVIARW